MKVEREPLVSIIVPIYNVEKQLDRCINSLLNQSLKNIEIILVDDESPDKCPQKCDEYALLDSRIRVIHKKNQGLGYARNSGIELAKGKFIAFVDSDDYVSESMYEDLCKTAETTGADTVISGFIKKLSSGKEIVFKEVEETTIYSGKERVKQLSLEMLGSLPEDKNDYKYEMSVWRGIYSRSIIEKQRVRFVSEREYISEDMFYHVDYLQGSERVAIIPKAYYYYCENEGSLSLSYRPDRYEKTKVMFYELIRRLKEYNYEDDIKIYLDRLLLARVRVAISQIVLAAPEKRKVSSKTLIKEIREDNLVSSILYSYPINKLPIQQRIFCYCLKLRLYSLIEQIIKLKYKAK